MRIFDQARSYLSFRDLCATRPVCREWMNIRSIPHVHPVYFFSDGSNVDLPDSDDPNFRTALLAANLQSFHCQIFNQDQLQFVLQILPNVKDLTIELDGRVENHLGPGEQIPQWAPNALSIAVNANKIDLSVQNFDGDIRVDFRALQKLTYFESDNRVQFENFDDREMESFGYITDFWDANATQIAQNSNLLRISRKVVFSNAYQQFLDSWARNDDMKPSEIEVNVLGMTFFTLSRDALTVKPIFGLPGVQYLQFVNEYRAALEQLLNRMPNVPIRFDPGCSEQMKQQWLQIINPIRSQYGLPPYVIN